LAIAYLEVVGKPSVDGGAQALRGEFSFAGERGDLADRVDTGVGS